MKHSLSQVITKTHRVSDPFGSFPLYQSSSTKISDVLKSYLASLHFSRFQLFLLTPPPTLPTYPPPRLAYSQEHKSIFANIWTAPISPHDLKMLSCALRRSCHRMLYKFSLEQSKVLISSCGYTFTSLCCSAGFVHCSGFANNSFLACWLEVAVPASQLLQKARMKLISREQCLERMPELGENVVCAELEKGEQSSCQVN